MSKLRKQNDGFFYAKVPEVYMAVSAKTDCDGQTVNNFVQLLAVSSSIVKRKQSCGGGKSHD
eukprot:scaffold23438_cov50-Attheya_sp.AAC.6